MSTSNGQSSSPNSSFTHNPQFTASIIGSQHIDQVRTRQLSGLFAICYLVMVVVVLLASTATAVFLELTVQAQIASISGNDMGLAMHSLVSLGLFSRDYLIVYQVATEFVPVILQEFDKALVTLKDTVDLVLEQLDSIPNSEFRDSFFEDWVLVWEVQNGTYVSRELNVLDTMQKFVEHVSTTQLKTSEKASREATLPL